MTRSGAIREQKEKDRVRDEIRAQVEEFLRKGGQINVFNSDIAADQANIGSVWHGQDELPGVID